MSSIVNRIRLHLEALEDRQLPNANSFLQPPTVMPAITAQVTTPAERVLEWNALALQAITIQRTAPPLASRNLAMVSIAMFDAANGITRQFTSYGTPAVGMKNANVEVSLSVAAHRVLSALFPNQRSLFDLQLKEVRAETPGGTSKLLGEIWGNFVGNRTLTSRRNDGSTVVAPYSSSGLVGRWEPTPPGFVQSPLLPQWPGVTPFALTSASQLRPPAPPALDSQAYAEALNEVKAVGSANSASRTADQTEVARFWAAGAGTVTPAGMWNVFAQQLARDANLSVTTTARMFAVLNVAMADAGIAVWDAKYVYDFWRPVTAIRKADLDDNAATTADPTWSSLIGTPPFPSYTSGHSGFSAAAAKVLTAFFGENRAFSGASDSLPGVTRSWSSFRTAANEAGMSRIYGGIHFSFDNVRSLAMGEQIGQIALQRFGVRPV